jgi:threonine dehydrogenase-like Zn-dependent dehydrogenase
MLEPAACVANGLLETELRPGLSVAVVGGGTLGLLAVSMLRLASPARLTVLDVREDRLALSRELGADETWNPAEGDPVKALGDDFDLVFESAGHPNSASISFQLARRGGTVILEGIAGGAGADTDPNLIVLRHLRVQGIFGASSRAWTWAVDLFAHGLLNTSRLITHQYALDDFGQAFQTLENPEENALKVQLRPERKG